MHKNVPQKLLHIQCLPVNGVNLGVVQYGEKRREGADLNPRTKERSVGTVPCACPPACGTDGQAQGTVPTERAAFSPQLNRIGPHIPLVLLHGFTGSALGWGHIITDLAARGLHIVALDMLGHGQSDAPAEVKRYRMEHCREDILAALQTLGIERGEAILLGYSMGGRIALYCAFSGYFRALILESASPGLATPAERQQRRASDEALATRIERDGLEAFIDYWEEIPLFASQQRLAAEQRQALHAQRLNNRVLGLANSLRGVGTGAQPELYTRLSTLNLPVLLLAGELDSKFCTIARQMASQLPQARLQIIPEAGHAIHLERPEAFVTAVSEFCALVLR